MNTPRLRRPLLALACACTAVSCLLLFGLRHPAAEARRQAAPSPDPSVSAVLPASPLPNAQPSPEETEQETPAPAPTGSAAVPASAEVPVVRRHRHAKPEASASPTPAPTPTSPAFSSLDGYWEVVLQTSTDNYYSRFDVHESAEAITGIWTRDGKRIPLEGTFTGRQFKFTGKDDAQKSYVLSGYIENASDMVGEVDDGSGKPPVAFTASHRAAFHAGNLLPKRGEKRGTSVP